MFLLCLPASVRFCQVEGAGTVTLKEEGVFHGSGVLAASLTSAVPAGQQHLITGSFFLRAVPLPPPHTWLFASRVPLLLPLLQ